MNCAPTPTSSSCRNARVRARGWRGVGEDEKTKGGCAWAERKEKRKRRQCERVCARARGLFLLDVADAERRRRDLSLGRNGRTWLMPSTLLSNVARRRRAGKSVARSGTASVLRVVESDESHPREGIEKRVRESVRATGNVGNLMNRMCATRDGA